MDRNITTTTICIALKVALRKESVDRNLLRKITITVDEGVALRKESVDRNTMRRDFKALGLLSLSARRAWIEIPSGCWRDARRAVALRKESVDRNTLRAMFFVFFL